jgi:hypothetical protein
MRRRTYHFTATVSDGKHHDGEHVGIVKARSEAEAVREDGARKKRTWTATHIELA